MLFCAISNIISTLDFTIKFKIKKISCVKNLD